jgi:ATP-dependent RNA helicase DbpA
MPGTRQTMLFSATFPDEVRAVAAASLRDPLEVRVDDGASVPVIDERFHEVGHGDRRGALERLLRAEAPASCVVFCNTRQDVDVAARHLVDAGGSALALHGDIEQRDREEVLVQFANGSARVLVASDVAARGLDIDALAMVVNFELPTDLDTYRHRIGRTGRAGRSGRAHSLVTPREMTRALALERAGGQPLRWSALPGGRGGDALQAPMATLRIDAGRVDKLRPGDVLGALTGDAGLAAAAIGKIDVFPTRSYVAIARAEAAQALKRLQAGKIKGRSFRVRRL